MSPPSATEPATENGSNGTSAPAATKEPAKMTLNPGLSKAQAEATSNKMQSSFLRAPTFTDKYEERAYLKGRLALAFRIFAHFGFDEGVAGHITLRDPVEPDSFWVNPFGVAWPLLKASDLIRVNHAGEVIEGGPCRLLNTAAYNIHHAIHVARPDINAIAHSHSIHGRAWCSLGIPLPTTTQDSCAFHNDLALYTSFGGVVLLSEEGATIAKALGDKKAALLQNHGLLTCGQSVESTVFWFMSLEKSCYVALLADAAAQARGIKPVVIGEEEAAYTYKTVGSEMAGWFSAKPTFDFMESKSGVDYKS